MRKLAMLVIAAAFLLPALPALATPPEAVHFVVPTEFAVQNEFTASGPAVDSGIMCPAGTVDDIFGKASGFQSERGVIFQVVKVFTCDDGSGSFVVKLQVRIDFKGDNFQWVVLGGEGDYSNLHGSGTGIGIDPTETSITDIYDGAVHID
jgi:hypothetical protein